MIKGLDHLVLTVDSIERSVAFYTSVLGMGREVFAGGRTALTFGTQKINLHEAGREFEPKAERPTPGSGDLCFIVGSLEHVRSSLERHAIDVIEGPVARNGAVGPITSIYCRDPDGNLIELAQYGS